MLQSLSEILSGAIFVIGVIAGIGPQNLNIISHAIRRNHAFLVALACFLSDIILIGGGGLGINVLHSKVLIIIINIVGAVFMVWYIGTKVHSLFKPHSKYHLGSVTLTKNQAVVKALAFTWLNPLVIIDTIVIIGGASSHYQGISLFKFLTGALLGDFIWIFGLYKLAEIFADKLNQVWIWITLDVMTIMIMSLILYKIMIFLV